MIDVDSADIMASLLILKADIENNIGSRMRMVFAGAAEAHLLAKEISEQNNRPFRALLILARRFRRWSDNYFAETVRIQLGSKKNVCPQQCCECMISPSTQNARTSSYERHGDRNASARRCNRRNRCPRWVVSS